jgi:HAD superfamily hydrolase (TIGR01490 family)
MNSESKNIIAAFDFDGTLTYHDLLFPFLNYVSNPLHISYGILCAVPYLPLGLSHPFYRQKAKETILSRVIGGLPVKDLKNKGAEFANSVIPAKLRPEGMQKLHWHQQQGHRCILISANLDIFLEPWAFYAGFHELICSKLEVDAQQNLTGKLVGLNCWGAEKKQRLLHITGPKSNYILYAYGNGKGDRELLQFADHAFYRKF